MKKVFVWAIAVLFLGSQLHAQAQQQGQLQGRLVNNAGKPVPSAKIAVRNLASGTLHEATTDQNGQFLIANLEPGKYGIEGQNGQNSGSNSAMAVDANGTNKVDIQVDNSGDIHITAQTTPADKSTASIKSVFNSTQVEMLPQPNAISRNGEFFGPYNLSLLGEGVTPGSPLQTGVGPSVGGRPNTSNNFHVDGTDNNNPAVPGPLAAITNEATTDFSLMQSQPAPQFGHNSGGQMNVIIAQGSEKWHGGVYDYFNNRKLNAVEPAITDNRAMRYDQNRFGGKAGGALIPKSLFAFFDFEYIPLRYEHVPLNEVLAPTPAGFFTAAGINGISLRNLGVLRNSVDVSNIPVATTTVRGTTIPLGLVTTRQKSSNDQYNGIAAFDWTINNRSRLGIRYVHNDVSMSNSNNALPAFTTPGHKRALFGQVNYTGVLSSTTTLNARVGYNRLDQLAGGEDFSFPGLTAFPNITIQNLGLIMGTNTPYGRVRGNTYSAAATADMLRHGHHLRFGVDARSWKSTFDNPSAAFGNYNYTSLERYLLDLVPDAGAQRAFAPTRFVGDRGAWYAFVEDGIRYSDIDFEFGLAYQYAKVPESLRRQDELAGLSVPGLITFAEPQAQKWNFAPRIGMAWSPNGGKTVIRAGTGMLYDALNGNNAMFSPINPVRTLTTPGPSVQGFLLGGGVPVPGDNPSRVSAYVFDQDLPYIINWNVAATHGFFGSLATEFKYMGHRGLHQPLQAILNDATLVNPSTSLPVFLTNPGQAVLNSLPSSQESLSFLATPYTAAGFVNPLFTVRPDGTSWYNAAVFKVSQTFTAGTQVSAQYTYSDLRTDTLGSAADLSFGRRMEQAPWNRKHRATISPLVDLASMLPLENGIMKSIVANMSFMATLSYARGPRVGIFTAADTRFIGTGAGSGVFVNPASTSGTGSGVSALTSSGGQTVAFLANDPNAQFISGAPGTYSADRPTLRLGDTRNVDLAIVKRFSFPEIAKAELRADAFNVFNHAQFTGLPVSTLGTSTVPQAFLNANAPQFNDLRGSLSGNPRTLQLALRLMF